MNRQQIAAAPDHFAKLMRNKDVYKRQRKPSVVYDRKNSSPSRFRAEDLPEWIYTDTRLFHTSGITLALSDEVCAAATAVIKRFKENGTLISFDVNYRANLWGEEKAKAAIEAVLPYIDILFISEESCRRMFGRTGELHDICLLYTSRCV